MSNVSITEVQLIPVKFKDGLTFFASCILDHKYFVGNIAIYSLKYGGGFRLVYPTKKLSNGQQVPLFYPISKRVGTAIQDRVSAQAEKLLSESDHTLDGEFVFGRGGRGEDGSRT